MSLLLVSGRLSLIKAIRDIESLQAGVIGIYVPPNVGTGVQIRPLNRAVSTLTQSAFQGMTLPFCCFLWDHIFSNSLVSESLFPAFFADDPTLSSESSPLTLSSSLYCVFPHTEFFSQANGQHTQVSS